MNVADLCHLQQNLVSFITLTQVQGSAPLSSPCVLKSMGIPSTEALEDPSPWETRVLIALNAGFSSTPHHLLWWKSAWFHACQMNCSVTPRCRSNLNSRTQESSNLPRNLHKSICAEIPGSHTACLTRGSQCHSAGSQTHRLKLEQCVVVLVEH